MSKLKAYPKVIQRRKVILKIPMRRRQMAPVGVKTQRLFILKQVMNASEPPI